MISLQSILVVWAIAAPVVVGGAVWGAMRAHEEGLVRGAVAGERARQIGICTKQLTDQAATLSATIMAGIGDAGAAADAVPSAPTVPSEIVDLCRSDTACRDREAAR